MLCLKNNDGDEGSCKKYFQLAASLCPSSWVRLRHVILLAAPWKSTFLAYEHDAPFFQVERWETEREEGNFAGVQFPQH